MTALIILSCIAAYLVTGAIYARSQAVKAYQRARGAHLGFSDSDIAERSRRESVAFQLAWRVAAWPYAIVFDLTRHHIRGWFFQDIDTRKQRATQLREDAKGWDEKRYDGTPAEQAMAAELAQMCRQYAKEVDL
jgi:hypothetical protein